VAAEFAEKAEKNYCLNLSATSALNLLLVAALLCCVFIGDK